MADMELNGTSAPPMANGEVVFEQPWQSRVFGLARVLCESGHYSWDDFRERLIVRIRQWEETSSNADYAYFDCFLAALSDVLDSSGLCSTDIVDQRTAEFAARPHGHDHTHGHGHSLDRDHDHDHDH
jgi:nitrile hydratase accessory protein